MLKITIFDSFFNVHLTGEFDTIEECKDYYAQELDTIPDEIIIKRIEVITE